MQKIIRIDNKVIVLFEDGSYIEKDDIDDAFYKTILEASSEEEIFVLCNPSPSISVSLVKAISTLKTFPNSKYLIVKGECIYWPEISDLSLPLELAEAILNAENEGNELLIETYKNFWTLMSLNPDEECRKNLYWFLKKWGLKIAKCGFFVAYRNVIPLETLEDGTEVFTDAYSKTTRIQIGEMVTMDRKQCDSDSNVSCSRGLHAGGEGWLNSNYFGSQGMVVLINPCDVVAVP